MAIKKTITLIFADAKDNHNKVWIGELHDDDTVITKWGRVGYDMQSKTFSSAGESFLLKKEREKIKKGYSEAKIVGGDISTDGGPAKVDNLQAIARQQLAKNHPELSKLIDRLVKANIHNITSQTNIVYNSTTGLFQTPLGPVTQLGIDEARNILVDIKKNIIDKKNSELKKLASDYLRIIPQNIGMRFEVSSIFPDIDAVKKQGDVLDSLEATLKSMTSSKKSDKTDEPAEEKVFEVDLDVLSDKNNEYDRLVSYYDKTKKSMHGYGHVKVRQIFSVKIQEMDKAFDRKLGNNVEVFHGTSQANLLSILKSGLKTAPPSSAFIAGKMFGNGIYGAINSSKSLGYTFGRWGGSSSGDSGWMFVCDFAMGKVHEPSSTCSRPTSGCDSVWAKANKVGLAHDELIVYKNNQVNIKYLMECK